MKKVMIMAAMLMLVPMASFADYTAGTAGRVTLGSTATLSVGVSNGVRINYTAATNGTGYAIGAYHEGGSRSFGSSSGDTSIFYDEATAVTLPTAPAGTASADWSSWDGAI